jgi:hypothetical protein
VLSKVGHPFSAMYSNGAAIIAVFLETYSCCTKYILNYCTKFVLFFKERLLCLPPPSSHAACSAATGTVLVLMSFLNFQQLLKLITRLSTGGLFSAGSERNSSLPAAV